MSSSSLILGTWDIITIISYFSILLCIGCASVLRRDQSTVKGYFLAGKQMTWLPIGASLFASNIGSEHFIGLSGSGASSGIAVAAFELNALFVLQLLGFVFVPVYIGSQVSTLPEYTKKRFGGERIRIILSLYSLTLYIFTKISVNLYSGGLFIQQALGWNIYTSIFAILIVTCLCTLGGGLTAVIFIDVLQVLIMIIGSSSLLFLGLKEVGGWNELQKKYMTSIPSKVVINPNDNTTCGVPPNDSWTLLRSPIDSELPWPSFLLGQTPASIWYWCADQIIVQKLISSQSLSHAQGPTLFTGILKILPFFLIVIPGMIARVLFTNTVGCVDPEICWNVCQNLISCSNIAYPKLILRLMPEGLRGLMISVMMAALMSDLTSIFNSASTVFTMDIYKSLRSKAKDSELIFIGRLFILALVALSICWIPLLQEMQGGQLYIYIQSIAAYLSPPIASIFTLAILWRRLNETGAFWSLICGFTLGVLRMGLDFSYPIPSCQSLDSRPWFLIQIHYMTFAAILFFSTSLLALLLSYLSPPPELERLHGTTFWTRFKELSSCPIQENEFVLEESSNEGSTQPSSSSSSKLHQTPCHKKILRLHLIFLLLMGLSLFVFFSINPFTEKEINDLRIGFLSNQTQN